MDYGGDRRELMNVRVFGEFVDGSKVAFVNKCPCVSVCYCQ